MCRRIDHHLRGGGRVKRCSRTAGTGSGHALPTPLAWKAAAGPGEGALASALAGARACSRQVPAHLRASGLVERLVAATASCSRAWPASLPAPSPAPMQGTAMQPPHPVAPRGPGHAPTFAYSSWSILPFPHSPGAAARHGHAAAPPINPPQPRATRPPAQTPRSRSCRSRRGPPASG